MFDVLIVDQDTSFCERLKTWMNWEDLNCHIIATSFSMHEAKEQLNLHPCDLVFYAIADDVRKEIADMQELKQRYPHLLILAMSQRTDFDTVRLTLKSGAYDYYLKDKLNKQYLIEIIEEAKKAYLNNREFIRLREETVMDKLRQFLILRKNHHDVTSEQFNDILSRSRYVKHNQSYQVGYFRIDNINLMYRNKVSNHAVLKQCLEEIIEHTLPYTVPHVAIFISNHSGVMILDTDNKKQAAEVCKKIIHRIETDLDLNLSISLSKVSHDRKEFFDLFEKLLEFHELRFYNGERILIDTEDQLSFQDLDMNAIDYHKEIVNKMSERDFISVLRLTKSALEYMRAHNIRPDLVKDYFIFILNNVEGNEIMRGSRNACGYDELKRNIRECESIEILSELIWDCFVQIELWLKDKGSTKYRQDISDIIEYINEHYRSKLTLKMIADYFKINESYLSRMFKNETGKNLIYFINELKMKKALELLSEPKIMIKEASSMIGIEDQFYFNKVFKKFYGVSPSEFRKKLHDS